MVAGVGDTAEGMINVDYKEIVEVLVEVYLKTINRRNAVKDRLRDIAYISII